MRGLPLYLDGNDDEPEEWPSRKNAATGQLEPASGLAGLTFRLSATENGVAIHASLQIAATERSSLAGAYYGFYQGDDLRTYLAPYLGKDVFQIFGDGTNVNRQLLRRVLAVRRD